MTVVEYGNDIIIVDCGMTFPEDEMLGRHRNRYAI